MASKTIEVAGLGRPLHPGMLYDCRNDSIIPGISLWDNETIKNGLDSRRQPKTDLNFSASDTVNEKAKLLELSASLKASFLSGLVEVEGSARYMNDSKSSSHQSRVTMQFSQTTKFERLTMDQLGNIQHKEVFEEGIATHVVTAVLYGGQAFLVFDLRVDENEDKEEIEGNLRVMVQSIPALSIEGAGSVNMGDAEKKLAESITCKFFGDYELEQNPTTYLEAIQVYKKLPSILRERENDAVPVKVWLYPLALLNEKAAILQREVHKTLIDKAETLLEELKNAEILCNDLITDPIINDFPDVKQRLTTFQDTVEVYKLMFLKSLKRLIPDIRAGKEQDQALANIIAIHQESPFTAEKLNKWLEYSQGEVNLLKLYTQQLSGVPVVKYTSLPTVLFDPNVDTVVCFCFTSLMDEDPFLSTLSAFVKVDVFETKSAIIKSADPEYSAWFHKPEIRAKIKDKLFLFKGFSQANKDEGKKRFVIMPVSDPSNPGISIRLYKNGKMVDSAFHPVSKPPAPKVNVQDTNVILNLQKPPTGSTLRFRVEYRIKQGTESETGMEKWELTDTPNAQENFTLTGLQLTKQYSIRYRVITEDGLSEASDAVLLSAHGRYKLSLSQRWDWVPSSFTTDIRCKVMSSLGKSWWNPSTIKPVVRNLARNPAIPYALDISKMKNPGTAFQVQGVVPENSDFIAFKFMIGKRMYDDMAFYMKIQPDLAAQQAVYNKGKWDKMRWIRGCPLFKGSTFDMFLVIENEGYVVYINGWRYSTFKHLIPVANLLSLRIEGVVSIKSVGVISNWSTSAFGNQQSYGTSRLELSKSRSDWLQPFCTPNKPYVHQIPGGLKHGLALFFQGLVPSDASRFEINLKTGPFDGNDIAFHFKSELLSVVCDSYKNRKWEAKKIIDEAIFAKGEGFDIIITVKPLSYDVYVNGREFCSFNHRIPVEKVTTLHICGDVLMNTCAIIHVDKFNLTCDLSAHI